ncbi:MAG: S-methyl-5-thioribose-1-phosphate isomerase [Myxococcota bacterium]|nr:S-methyl-5-thioribose-1-phosphate isomerase [Myxococcota bacterium]
MRVDGEARRSIWLADDGESVEIVDQTRLPFAVELRRLETVADAADAIATMAVRGAPLIGVTAAYGLWLALREDASDASLDAARHQLLATRPTAVNLRWALDRVGAAVRPLPIAERAEAARAHAGELADADVATCRSLGEHGVRLIEEARSARPHAPVNVLTHCNAGWLACVDWGTALAPIYLAQRRGIPVHVWVDETRPRSQGALTAWELGQEGIAHTVVADNAGGHLMQRGQVDLCIVGTDRTTARGDVCNKIGTYLKALAAREHDVPFYVAAPSSSIDWSLDDGVAEIPIEERDGAEVSRVRGWLEGQGTLDVSVLPEKSAVANPAFDVTPAPLVTGLVTERGVCAASREGLAALFPEHAAGA